MDSALIADANVQEAASSFEVDVVAASGRPLGIASVARLVPMAVEADLAGGCAASAAAGLFVGLNSRWSRCPGACRLVVGEIVLGENEHSAISFSRRSCSIRCQISLERCRRVSESLVEMRCASTLSSAGESGSWIVVSRGGELNALTLLSAKTMPGTFQFAFDEAEAPLEVHAS